MNRTGGLLAILLIPFLAGCSGVQDGTGRYRIQSVGNAQRSVEAVVLVARPAYIASGNSGAGAALGGAVGGALASEGSDNAGVVIAGIIGGMIVGSAIEGEGRVYDATEYVIKSETGVLVTVAQINNGNPIFKPSDKVVLVYGYPSRLIALPH